MKLFGTERDGKLITFRGYLKT